MRKIFILCSGIILVPSLGWGGAVTGYIAANCAASSTNSSIIAICDNSDLHGCSSSGSGVTTSGTYKDYDNCARNQGDVILCFTDGAACRAIKNGSCHSNYLGTVPAGINAGGFGLGRTITVYPEQITCCQSSSCTGYAADKTISDMPQIVYSYKKTCSTDGTCSTLGSGRVRCARGYFSSTGKSSVALSSGTNPRDLASQLGCTSCATYTNKTDATTTGPGATSVSACYVPAGHTETDTTGTWQFTANCNYTP